MSVVVNSDSVVEISFYYKEIKNQEDKTCGVEIVDVADGANVFTGMFAPASFEVMASVKEQATVINHVNEKSILRYSQFVPLLLSALCQSWNLCSDDGSVLPPTVSVMRSLHSVFVEELFRRWCLKTGYNIPVEPTEEQYGEMYKKIIHDISEVIRRSERENG